MLVEMFPEEVIELQKELSSGFHPNLVQLLARIPPDEAFEEILAWCGMEVDGFCDDVTIRALCLEALKRLQQMRSQANSPIILQ